MIIPPRAAPTVSRGPSFDGPNSGVRSRAGSDREITERPVMSHDRVNALPDEFELPAGPRICRVVLLYKEENFEAALDAFRSALGVDDFEGPLALPEMGLKIAISWNSGLELITPHGQGSFAEQMRHQLASKGEGLVSLVFQVPELDSGVARAAAAGYPAFGPRIDCLGANPTWKSRFAFATEAPLTSVAGIDIALIHLEPVRRIRS